MGIPMLQAARIGSYIFRQHLSGRKRYPLVLMLEPLFRCNLACAGCGKIDYPDKILNKRLTVEECLGAAEECGAPVVAIAGGEPLLHKEMPQVVQGLLDQGRIVILCTNALLLDKRMDGFGELFRALSFEEIGTSTLQSRAFAGLANATFLFALPGSTSACRTAWEQIIRAQLDSRTRPCNLAQLRPRLRE